MRFTDAELADGHRTKAHALERALTCSKCSYICKSSEELEAHLQEHASGACPVCHEDFWLEDRYEVDEHMVKAHGRDLRRMCPTCDYSCSELVLFRWHVDNMHPEEGRAEFECDACGKKYGSRVEYATHKCVLSGAGGGVGESPKVVKKSTLLGGQKDSLVEKNGEVSSSSEDVSQETSQPAVPIEAAGEDELWSRPWNLGGGECPVTSIFFLSRN